MYKKQRETSCDPVKEVAAMTRKLISAGGATAASAVQEWATAHADATHAKALLSIAGSYDFVSEEERVELLNNTVAYYVRDTSMRCSLEDQGKGAGRGGDRGGGRADTLQHRCDYFFKKRFPTK
jgi:hypothetical protein